MIVLLHCTGCDTDENVFPGAELTRSLTHHSFCSGGVVTVMLADFVVIQQQKMMLAVGRLLEGAHE